MKKRKKVMSKERILQKSPRLQTTRSEMKKARKSRNKEIRKKGVMRVKMVTKQATEATMVAKVVCLSLVISSRSRVSKK
jgi:hypothetical protein